MISSSVRKYKDFSSHTEWLHSQRDSLHWKFVVIQVHYRPKVELTYTKIYTLLIMLEKCWVHSVISGSTWHLPCFIVIKNEAAQSSLDRVQNHLHTLVGDDLFSTLQSLSNKHNITSLLLFPWQLFRGALFFSFTKFRPLLLRLTMLHP